MPPLPSVPNVLELVVHQHMGSVNPNIINRFFLRYTGTAPSPASLTTLAGVASTAWGTDMKPHFHADHHVDLITIVDLSSPTGASGQDTSDVQGVLVGGSLPTGVAAVVKGHISRRYRGGHPRSYFAAGDAAQLASHNEWITSFWLGMASGMTSWTAAITAALPAGVSALEMVSVSRYSGFTETPVAGRRTHAVSTPRAVAVIDPITGYSCDLRVGSQRRRNLTNG